MNKKIVLGIFLMLILILTSTLSLATYSTVQMEVVEKPICTIDIGENSKFQKSLVSEDLKNKEVTLELKVTNEELGAKPNGELMLVIDNSDSMNNEVESGEIRSDLVYESAKTLVSKLLEDNTNLKIGIVSFSSNTEQNLEATIDDAALVAPLSNDANTLTKAITNIQKNGPRTDLDAGLTLAMEEFSKEDTNKYMIVLTDGVPNIALDYDNKYYSDDVIEKTKAKLESVKNSGINLITMLTGIDAPDYVPVTTDKSFAEIISMIFGTPENPTAGHFYYVTDDQVETTITDDIYNSLLPTGTSLKDITITDYFPKEIIDNFEFAYIQEANIGEISAEVNKENNSITWTIPELEYGKTATVQYTLSLKENFDSSIVGKILDTNEKVDISYTDVNNNPKESTSDVTPKLKLSEPPVVLPKAGTRIFISLIAVAGGFLVYSLVKLTILNKKMKY